MLSNRNYYLEDLRANVSWFAARPEAVAYSEREAREAKFVELVEGGFHGFNHVKRRNGHSKGLDAEIEGAVVRAETGERIPEPLPPPVVKLEL